MFLLYALNALTAAPILRIAPSTTKSIDEGSSITGGAYEQQRSIYQAFDPRLHRALSAFDIRNNFTANFTYELPWARNLTGVAGLLGGGWQINGILLLSNGHPVTVLDNNDAQADRLGGSGERLRPDLVPGGNKNPVLGGPDRYFDPSHFKPSELGYFGTLGRGTLITPGLATFDLGVFKAFGLRGRSRLQFRTEVFNLVNRVNFGTPSTTVILSDGTLNAGAGRVTTTRTTARQIQLGLRFVF